MINTILKGLFSMIVTMSNFFLQPIYDLIDDIDLGGFTFSDILALMNAYIGLLRNALSWVADATGLPGWLFGLMALFTMANITTRVAVYVIKLLLKWYRKLMP